MILRKATTAYLLILASLTLIPVSVYLTSPTAQSNSGSSQTPAHSETNQQVSGVDELDTVKNDGQYIYTITNNTVAIVQAYPATNAALVSKVTVNGTLQGIFTVDNRLVVVSQEPGYPYAYYGGGAKPPTLDTGIAKPSGIATIYPIGFSGTTSLFVFDINNHASPVLTTRVEVNGTLAGARLVGNYVY